MTPLKRRIAAVSVPALLALSLTACGGGAPTDASKADFCEAYNGIAESALDLDDEKKFADALNDAGDDLEKVGTPEDISDEEREGFEVVVKAYQDIDEDAVKKLKEVDSDDEDAANEALGVSSDESDKASKFEDYAGETCAEDS